MNKTFLMGMTAVALSLGACAKRTPPPEPAVPQGPWHRSIPIRPIPTAWKWSSCPLSRPTWLQGGIGYGLFRHRRIFAR